jgi:hypothetical protein
VITAEELEACQRVWHKGRDPGDLAILADVSERVEREYGEARGYHRWRRLTKYERKAWVEVRDDRGKIVAYRNLPKQDGERRWLCVRVVGPLIAKLSRWALGWCNASAKALRYMIFVDYGYVFGEGSIGRFTLREWRRGKLRHKQCRPGWYFAKTKQWTDNGTQINRYPSEAERRDSLWRAKVARRKQRAEQRKQRERQKQERLRLGREMRRQAAAAADIVRPSTAPSGRRAIVVDPELGAQTRAHVAQALAAIAEPPALELGGARPPRRPSPPRAEAEPRDVHDWDPAPPGDDDET